MSGVIGKSKGAGEDASLAAIAASEASGAKAGRYVPIRGISWPVGASVSLNISISAMRSHLINPAAPTAHGGYTA